MPYVSRLILSLTPILPNERKVTSVKTPFASSLALAIAILSLAGAASRSADAQGNRQDNWEPPVVYQASGPNNASIIGTIDEFRNALGGANNGNNAGPLADGRREINWDGGGAATTPAATPFNGFLNNRGALFATPGSGFVQAPPSGIATTFGNLSYEGIFRAFSQQRLFSPIGDSRTDVTAEQFAAEAWNGIRDAGRGGRLLLQRRRRSGPSDPSGAAGDGLSEISGLRTRLTASSTINCCIWQLI